MGHAPGGVCPFGVNEGVAVYLDESLRKFDTVYPAAGNGHTAVKLTLQELEAAAGAEDWGGCLQGAGRRIKRVHPAVLLLDGPFCDSQRTAGNIDSVLQT